MDDELVKIRGLLDEVRQMTSPQANGVAQITVSAGGVGVWVAVFCASICAVMVFVLGLLYLDQSRKIDNLNDYLTAIYMQAPYLQPESKK